MKRIGRGRRGLFRRQEGRGTSRFCRNCEIGGHWRSEETHDRKRRESRNARKRQEETRGIRSRALHRRVQDGRRPKSHGGLLRQPPLMRQGFLRSVFFRTGLRKGHHRIGERGENRFGRPFLVRVLNGRLRRPHRSRHSRFLVEVPRHPRRHRHERRLGKVVHSVGSAPRVLGSFVRQRR